jgi:arsenite methyltransferase
MRAESVQSKPDYGIDAPGLVRFFFIAGAVALVICLVVLLSSILGQIPKTFVGALLSIAATYLLGMGCFMLYFSKIVKKR